MITSTSSFRELSLFLIAESSRGTTCGLRGKYSRRVAALGYRATHLLQHRGVLAEDRVVEVTSAEGAAIHRQAHDLDGRVQVRYRQGGDGHHRGGEGRRRRRRRRLARADHAAASVSAQTSEQGETHHAHYYHQQQRYGSQQIVLEYG